MLRRMMATTVCVKTKLPSTRTNTEKTRATSTNPASSSSSSMPVHPSACQHKTDTRLRPRCGAAPSVSEDSGDLDEPGQFQFLLDARPPVGLPTQDTYQTPPPVRCCPWCAKRLRQTRRTRLVSAPPRCPSTRRPARNAKQHNTPLMSSP